MLFAYILSLLCSTNFFIILLKILVKYIALFPGVHRCLPNMKMAKLSNAFLKSLQDQNIS